MTVINDALADLHAINVLIDAYEKNKGLDWDGRKVDLKKVSELLYKTRKTLEVIRNKE